MSFFKDFKEDLSQAVSELIPSEEELLEKFGGVQETEVATESDATKDTNYDNLVATQPGDFIVPEEGFVIPEETSKEEVTSTEDSMDFIIPKETTEVTEQEVTIPEIELESKVTQESDVELPEDVLEALNFESVTEATETQETAPTESI